MLLLGAASGVFIKCEVMFSCRIFNYVFSMCKLLYSLLVSHTVSPKLLGQANKFFRDLSNGDTRRCGLSLLKIF